MGDPVGLVVDGVAEVVDEVGVVDVVDAGAVGSGVVVDDVVLGESTVWRVGGGAVQAATPASSSAPASAAAPSRAAGTDMGAEPTPPGESPTNTAGLVRNTRPDVVFCT
jgi:hypothetical protein